MKRYTRQTDGDGVFIWRRLERHVSNVIPNMFYSMVIPRFSTKPKPLYTIRNGLIVRVTMGMYGTSCQIDPDYLALLNEVESK